MSSRRGKKIDVGLVRKKKRSIRNDVRDVKEGGACE